jgi:predicted RNase H-like HicB family nuclease
MLKKRERYWLSICPPLDVCSQGPTKQEAKKNITEAITLFLVSCFESGTLDQALKECGFHHEKNLDSRTETASGDYITIPLPLARSGRCSTECHA